MSLKYLSDKKQEPPLSFPSHPQGRKRGRAFLQWSSTDIQWLANQIPRNQKCFFLVFEAEFYSTSFPVDFRGQKRKIKSLNFQTHASVLKGRVKEIRVSRQKRQAVENWHGQLQSTKESATERTEICFTSSFIPGCCPAHTQ